MLVRSRLGLLCLSLLVCQKALKELNLCHEEGTHEGSSLWFIYSNFSADFLSELLVRSLVSRLAILYSGVKISKRDDCQDGGDGKQ